MKAKAVLGNSHVAPLWGFRGAVVTVASSGGGRFFLTLLLDVDAVMGDADEQVCYFYLKRKEKCGLPSFLLKALFIHYVPTCLREKLFPACEGVARTGRAEEHLGAGVSGSVGTCCRVRGQTGRRGREATLRGPSGWSRRRGRNRRFGIGAPA